MKIALDRILHKGQSITQIKSIAAKLLVNFKHQTPTKAMISIYEAGFPLKTWSFQIQAKIIMTSPGLFS